MKKKLIALVLTAAAVSLFAFTACGEGTETESETVSSAAESNVISETSASLGIYVQDTDNDGVPDKVVDRDGNDLGHLYTLKEDGIYEEETLILPIENTELYTASETSAVESTEQSEKANTEAAENTNQNGTQQQANNGNSGTNVNADTGTGSSVNTNTSKGNTNTANHANTGGGSITTTAPAQPAVHAPLYQQQYVVDTPAGTETVTKPVYGNKTIWICNTCGMDITDDVYGHIDTTMHGGYSSKVIQIQTGTRTEYINHEEIGHWENVLICNGCTGAH